MAVLWLSAKLWSGPKATCKPYSSAIERSSRMLPIGSSCSFNGLAVPCSRLYPTMSISSAICGISRTASAADLKTTSLRPVVTWLSISICEICSTRAMSLLRATALNASISGVPRLKSIHKFVSGSSSWACVVGMTAVVSIIINANPNSPNPKRKRLKNRDVR